MPTLTKRTDLPDLALPTVELVERFGFSNWRFDYEYSTPQDSARRVQVRDERHYAPAAMVTQIAASMRRGDKMPPIVVTADGYLVDGNTRSEAAKHNRFPAVHAVILSDRYEGASDGVRRRLHLLGAAFNTRNGKGIDRSEIAIAVQEIGNDRSYDASRIAELLGVTDSQVRNILAEKRARDRAERHGVHLNGSVPGTQLRRLGQSSEKLNDQPFVELVRLTQDCGLTSNELSDLIGKCRGSGSDDAALALLVQERAARAEQIAEFRARGKAKPPYSAQLRQRLGFLLQHEDDPSRFVEYSPNLADDHRQQVTRAIDVLRRVLDAQTSLLPAES